MSSQDREIQVAFTDEEDPIICGYWPAWDAKKLNYIGDFYNIVNDKKIIDQIGYICFATKKGIYLELGQSSRHSYVFEHPGPDVLEYLCEMKLFGPEANAKMWYAAFKYALKNEDCLDFWKKYKNTVGGARFMALILGSKEDMDD
jgi:hypothetical protein